jgi:hypothetical protein
MMDRRAAESQNFGYWLLGEIAQELIETARYGRRFTKAGKRKWVAEGEVSRAQINDWGELVLRQDVQQLPGYLQADVREAQRLIRDSDRALRQRRLDFLRSARFLAEKMKKRAARAVALAFPAVSQPRTA